MGVGQELANMAIEKGKNFFKDLGKKIAGALLKNPYFYIVVAVIFVIIIIAGTMVDVNAGATSNTEGMNSASSSAWEQFIKYLHAKEGGGTIYKNSNGIDCYQVVSDGSTTGSAVGYGVDIGVHGAELEALGYETSIGSLIPVEIVDAIEIRIREDYYTQISEKIKSSGINMTQYQLFALTSRAYNCGIAGAITTARGSKNLNFIDSYNEYYNQNSDDKFDEKITQGDYTNKLYTEYMSLPVYSKGQYLVGLENRRKSEWTLFQTGYYDVLGEWYQELYLTGTPRRNGNNDC